MVDYMPFSSHLAISLGFFLGIIPAITLVFMTLKEYDDYYEDKNFFFLMVVGLFGGTMTGLIYYWSVLYLVQTESAMVLLSIIFGFAVYEVLLFTIVLSMKRFGANFELTYYGVVFGGSIAGIMSMFFIYAYLNSYDINSQAIMSIGLLVPTLPMMYISLSSMVGFGLHTGHYFKYAGWAIVIKTIFNLLLFFWFVTFWFEPPGYGWEFMTICLGIAILMYFYAIKDVLPAALSERLQRHKRRAKRKRKRK